MTPHSAIREANKEDFEAICNIYNHYIRHSTATFDTEIFTAQQLAAKILVIQKDYPVLVLTEDELVVGYAYASQWKAKPAYRHTAETTVYIHPEHHNKKYGIRLYNALLSSLPLFQINQAIACITSPNDISEKLHEKLGFERVGVFTNVGYKFDKWIDVTYWQKEID